MSSPKISLTRKLVLEDPQRTQDGAGGFNQSWAPLGELWAQMTPLSGRTAGQDGGSLLVQRYRMIVRAAPEGAVSRPCVGQRFREASRLFCVEAVTEVDSKGRYLSCLCLEEVAP